MHLKNCKYANAVCVFPTTKNESDFLSTQKRTEADENEYGVF